MEKQVRYIKEYREFDDVDDDRPILYVDMDGVICDFDKSADKYIAEHPEYDGDKDEIPNLFSVDVMMPVEGAIEAVKLLAEKYNLYILTTAPWGNATSLQDKKNWIKHYFGDVLKKRLIITHRKDLCEGDYLIDDNPNRNLTYRFKGEILSFGKVPKTGELNEFPNWDSILKRLM